MRTRGRELQHHGLAQGRRRPAAARRRFLSSFLRSPPSAARPDPVICAVAPSGITKGTRARATGVLTAPGDRWSYAAASASGDLRSSLSLLSSTTSTFLYRAAADPQVKATMSAPGPPPPPPDLAAITSATLVGSLLNFMLYGALAVQVYVYNICFPTDRAPIKYLVYTVFALQTLCLALNGADAQFWYAAHFGDLRAFADVRFSAFYTPIMGSLVALAVQLFYCVRITVFRTGSRAVRGVVGVIALAAVMQAVGGMGGGIKAYVAGNQEHDQARTVLVYMWLVGDAVADILIAVTMTHILRQATAESTKQIVRGVVRLVIETNALSSASLPPLHSPLTSAATVALLGLILFAGVPGTTYFIAPTMILPGLYANTLLVVLNNRAFATGAAVRALTRPGASGSASDDVRLTHTDTASGAASRALEASRTRSMRVQSASRRLRSDTLQPVRRPRGASDAGIGPESPPPLPDRDALGSFVAAPNPRMRRDRDPLDTGFEPEYDYDEYDPESGAYVDDRADALSLDDVGAFVAVPGSPGAVHASPPGPVRVRGVSWSSGAGSSVTRANSGGSGYPDRERGGSTKGKTWLEP
ncbi:hypothetical protein MIND_01264700 [Mycena indigotica]|uniref:DUF6534 domain-containing protein n=1 Tax=Mycena indigotica TaxID=2126181 RepID=A0A8H6VV36_9AGAR|nr:uncharacterized protein MIND_01264700 [Mycena indigotica]KAF7291213.1 hypothetical protein MIND_01264700 [Mycena indigotica]